MMVRFAQLCAVFTVFMIVSQAHAQNAPTIYLGVKTCANSACHGGAVANPNSKVQRNEYTFWRDKDPHSKAYKALLGDRAKRIASNLGLGPANEAKLCLDCHATNIPPEQRGIEFDVADGIQCETCHGAAVGWLGIHSAGIATRAQNVQAGLFPTEDPVKRADMCLDCHFGAKDQFANHRLMGAGHPRISFELDSYTWFNAHHTLDQDYIDRKPYVDGVRTWAIGAAKMIERRMTLLIDNDTGSNGFFPEFAFFDCQTCHRPMSQLRWKPRGIGLPPGTPKVDDSHMAVLVVALEQIDPALAKTLGDQMLTLHKSSVRGRAEIVAAAEALKATAVEAVPAVAGWTPSSDAMRAILARLVAKGAKGDMIDYASAEQATLVTGATIDALYRGGHITEAQLGQMLGELDKAYDAVQKDDRYDPNAFVQAMKSLQAAIR